MRSESWYLRYVAVLQEVAGVEEDVRVPKQHLCQTLPVPGPDWDGYVWGVWINPQNMHYVDCDASTHTLAAVEWMGIDMKIDPDDLEDAEVINAVIQSGWVRVRFDYSDQTLYLNGEWRNCRRIANEFVNKRGFPIVSIVVEYGDQHGVFEDDEMIQNWIKYGTARRQDA